MQLLYDKEPSRAPSTAISRLAGAALLGLAAHHGLRHPAGRSNAGASAAVGLFALKLAGFPVAANYAGSWYEWEADPANPIETG
jgi:thiosulfate/3-mercaptopyruvate sulfurtransferase